MIRRARCSGCRASFRTSDDIDFLLGAVDSNANGLTLCTGSLGAGASNDLPAMARRFASRTHFVHLRNVSKEPDGSFRKPIISAATSIWSR